MGQNRHFSTEAIILKTINTGEIDKFFNFISPDIGISSAIAFGGARNKSKFCASILPYAKLRMFLYSSPKYKSFKLEDFSNVVMNDFISSNLNNFYIASFFTEVLLNCFITVDEYKSYFFLLKYSLELLKEGEIFSAFIFFTSKLFFLYGYSFNLRKCKKCNKEFDSYFFEINRGGIYCTVDSLEKKYNISKKSALLWDKFLNEKYIDLKKIHLEKIEFIMIYKITKMLLYNIFEKKLNTIDYLNKIFLNN